MFQFQSPEFNKWATCWTQPLQQEEAQAACGEASVKRPMWRETQAMALDPRWAPGRQGAPNGPHVSGTSYKRILQPLVEPSQLTLRGAETSLSAELCQIVDAWVKWFFFFKHSIWGWFLMQLDKLIYSMFWGEYFPESFQVFYPEILLSSLSPIRPAED